MKLYTVPLSPNCRRVEATIRHLRLDVETISIDTSSGHMKSAEYLRLNPNGKAPLLVDGGFMLWESNAIMQYLADLGSAPAFFPEDARARADITRWQFWEALYFNRAVMSICWETLGKPMMGQGEADEHIVASSLSEFEQYATVLNDHLTDKIFMMGNKLTLADFSVGSISTFALMPGSRIPLDSFPNIRNWYQRLQTVPAWAETSPL